MKGKMGLLTKFKWILKMLIPTVEMLKKEIQSLNNFPFMKIVVQSFFPERDAFNANKTSLFISFTEWNEPKLPLYIRTYLTWYNFLLFSIKNNI